MKVQCKCCKKLHVNGEWTSETAVRAANIYTYCPSCYENVLDGALVLNSTAGFSRTHTAAS